jgi:L-threonylcarbamoyladenylate synthase
MATRPRESVHALSPSSLKAAAARIRRGELVAFPTETVYGLGANALDQRAVAKIFAAKGRPSDNPIIVHVSDRKMLRSIVAKVPATARRLMDRFWPGPLTLVLPKKPSVPDLVTAGLATVAVRMPEGAARDLVRAAGVPIAAPSANLSGRPSPTTAQHVAEDFPDIFILDGGPTKHGVESTVLALDPVPRILRHGAVSAELLRKVIGGLKTPRSSSSPAPESPGTKYSHYAPARPLILFRNIAALRAYSRAHPKALVICPARFVSFFPKQNVLSLGDSAAEMARRLFPALRTRRRGSELLVLAVRRRGLGRTIMDRLTRAATRIVP